MSCVQDIVLGIGNKRISEKQFLYSRRMNKIKVIKIPMILTWAIGWMPLNGEYKWNNKKEDRKEEFGFETSDQLGMTLAARNNFNQQSLSNRH